MTSSMLRPVNSFEVHNEQPSTLTPKYSQPVKPSPQGSTSSLLVKRKENYVSYQNLSDVLFKKEYNFSLSSIPFNQRLYSICSFKKIIETLRQSPMYPIVMRAQQLMEDDIFEKVKEKAEQQMKEIGSPRNDGSSSPRKSNKSSIKTKKKKFVRTQSRIQISDEALKDKSSLEARIFEVIKYNKLVRTFVKVVTDKDRLFHLEFTSEYLGYLILAFFEKFNLNKIPHDFLAQAVNE